MSLRPPSCLLCVLFLVCGCNTREQVPVAVVTRDAAPAPGAGPKVKVVGTAEGSEGICRVREMNATFDTPMDPASIDEHRFVLVDAGVPVAGRVSLDGTGRTARFVPADAAGFAPSRTIVAVLLSGPGGVRSRAGQPMAEDRTWVFTTGWHLCNGSGLKSPAPRLESSPASATK